MPLLVCMLPSVPENPKRVLVQKLALLVEGRPDMELDLSGQCPLNLGPGSMGLICGWKTEKV